MIQTIEAARLIGSAGLVEHPLVEIEAGRILRIHSLDTSQDQIGADFSFPEAFLAPCYFDVHFHGAVGHDVMEGASEALSAIEGYLAGHGIGAYLPTTVTSPVEKTLRALDLLAGRIEQGSVSSGAVPLGIHLEGPFLSPAKRGVHPADCLLEPSIQQFDRFWQASHGQIRLMTIAPEMPHAIELIRYAASLGVKLSLGHSNASYAEAEAGFRAGASTATHTFNAMRTLRQRDPGIAGYVLDNEDLYADIVCDGLHVDPALVRLFFKAKGKERAILITDALAPTGMPAGRYWVGDLEVEVEAGRCVHQGVIAGSILSLDQAVRNFMRFTHCSLIEAVRLATVNPARMTGFGGNWGLLEDGRDANLIALSSTGEILQVFRSGRPVLTS